MFQQENTIKWGEMRPLTLEKEQVPYFPVEKFPKTIADYVFSVSEFTQTNPDMASVVALGVLATCNQRKFVVQESHTEPLNLYTVIVAEPGERKSAVLQLLTQDLLAYQKEENHRRQDEINSYQVDKELLESEIRQLKEKKKINPEDLRQQLLEKTKALQNLEEVRPIRNFCDDCSPEALVGLLAKNNGAMSVISAEGGIFDIIAGRYSAKPNLDVFLKGHSGDEIMVDRKSSEAVAISNPALTFVLAIQPDLLQEIMGNHTLGGRGLLARFLYSVPKSTVGNRKYSGDKIPFEVAQKFKWLINDLLSVPTTDNPRILSISSEAKVLLEEYFYIIEGMLGKAQTIKNWLSKHIGAVMRIAGNLHLASEEKNLPCITKKTVESAIEMGKYFGSHARYSFVTLNGEEEMKKAKDVLSILTKMQENPVTRRELFRKGGNRGLKKLEELCPTLDLLEDYGYIKQVRMIVGEGSTKPSDLIFLNPQYEQNINN
ncbi:MAG: YfjI family protein [Eubacteriales bacterium]